MSLQGKQSLLKGGRRIVYPDTVIEATIYRPDGTTIPLTGGSNTLTGKSTSDILNCSTHKTIGQPMGTWSMTLVPRQDYLSLIEPGFWCEIKVDNNDGSGPRVLQYGPVGRVRQSKTVNESNGAVHTTVNVEGSDFGKAIAFTTALLDATLARDPAFSNLGWAAGAIGNIGAIIDSPGGVLKAIIKHYFSTGINQLVDPKTGRPFAESLKQEYIADDLLGEAVYQPIILSSPLWQVLQQYANLSVNELFIDYRPPITNTDNLIHLNPNIVLRQQPFYGKAWDNLTAVEVLPEECINETFERSDQDVKNWIRVMDDQQVCGYENGNLAVYLGIGALNNDSIKKFGICRHEPTTIYAYQSKDNPGQPKTIADILEAHTGLNLLWHHSNELLYNGSLTLYMRPDIRVGYRLDYVNHETDKTLQAYVEDVQHAWAYPGRSTTSVTITRGRDPKDKRFTNSLDQLHKYHIITPIGNTVLNAQRALIGKI